MGRLVAILGIFLVGWAWAVSAEGEDFLEVVVPSGAATVEAETHLVFPWDCGISVASLRQQQIFLGTALGQGEIVEIRFRQDAELGQAFGPAVLSDTTIRLSSTDREIDQLSLVFNDNLSDDAKVVYQGNLSLSSALSPEIPRPFDIVIPLQTPFSFAGTTARHLLLDVILPNCALTTAFDATLVLGDEVARIWEPNATSAVATRTDTVGLITEFVFQSILSDGFETGNTVRWTIAVP